eukprot:7139376-Heterocapsa_arctica.AAC.1
MFEDLGNKAYTKALEANVTDPDVLWLNVKHKGDVVECIMAMGFIYQNSGSTNKVLEGIIELVIHLENQLKAPQIRPSKQDGCDEQEMLQPVNRK